MKIGYFADGPWAHLALESIIARNDLSIAFMVARHDSPDPVLRQRAATVGIPFFTHSNVNSDEFLEQIAPYQAELFVSMSFNQILRQKILSMPPKGFINCHAGALPFYRGRNVLNWALINGEERLGVTAHYIDAGIDTGDIIIQKFRAIAPTDTYATLLQGAYSLCAETLLEALDAIVSERATRVLQSTIHPVGTYFPQRCDGDEWIDWSWSSRRIFNLVRAISPPGPGARTGLGLDVFGIAAAEMISNAPVCIGAVGSVVGVNSRGIVVKTGDSTLLVTQGGAIGPRGSLIDTSVPKHKIGTRFIGYLELRVRLLDQRINVHSGDR